MAIIRLNLLNIQPVNDLFSSYINVQTGVQKTTFYKGTETAYVQQVKVLGGDTGQDELQNAVITLRIVVRRTENYQGTVSV